MISRGKGGQSSTSHHFTRVDLGDNRLHRPAVVQTFKVHEQEPTRQLHLRRGGDEFRGGFSWGVLEAELGQW